MKNVMQIAMVLMITASMFSGCQQDLIQPGTAEISVNDLPKSAVNFINSNYDITEVSQAMKHRSETGDDIYEASFSWGTDLFFSKRGKLRGLGDDDNSSDDYISLSSLPDAIRSFVSAEYGLEIIEAERNHHPDGSHSFEVELSNGWEVYFDQSGNFIFRDDKGGRSKGESSHVPTSSLPDAIKTYVASNYPGATIVKAEKKFNEDGSFRKYEIELSNGMELYFSESGQFLRDDSSSSSSSSSGGFDDSYDIPISDLPQKARDYISDNYSGRTIDRAKIKLNDDRSVRSYEVRLSDKTRVFFDADGNYTGSDN